MVTPPVPVLEFLGVPLFDDDLVKLIVRFVCNLIAVGLIVYVCYYPHQKKRPFVFTFLLMNVMVFFICFTLKKLELQLGIALGLFAIFAIIRYRTDAIKVKEMTYLFIVIGIAVINSLSNKKTSYAELIFANATIFLITYLLERYFMSQQLSSQSVVYDNLELIQPDRRAELLADIQKRTGLDARLAKVGKVDLQKGVANLEVYYSSTGSE